MTVPAWILDIFAVIMLAVAAVSAARLVIARSWSRPTGDADIDVAHILMGIAMAGMLASGLQTLPSDAWTAIFGVVTAWLAWRVAVQLRRGAGALAGHHLPHLVHAAAMVYMFAAVSTPAAAAGSSMTGMAGMGGAAGSMGTLRVPTLGLLFVIAMVAWAVWDLDQLTNPGGRRVLVEHVAPIPAILRNRIALAAATAGPVPEASLSAASVSAAGLLASGEPAGGEPAGGGSVSGGSVAAPSARTAKPADTALVRILLDPAVTVGSRVAMGVTMALMLVLMI